ncbi:MAG TPA: FIST C-terminal domain-containing protein [Bacillota bacterium]|nr:FIST C-terminal domain-containing protein [Bacillota bacterium]HOL10417.1 FIST C-terminal domain-containing protein [Bacillota bacterium]HPO96768.1 FIST C-terminal domain-containing protein [Bacillota bacterium]
MYVNTFDELIDCVEKMTISRSEKLMVLTADKSADEVPKLIEWLTAQGIKFFGGIYPALLVGDKAMREGFVIQKYQPIFSSMVLPQMIPDPIDPNELEDATAIVLVDGLSNKFKSLTDTVYQKLGDKVKYIGGGAGFYGLAQKPCIYDNDGLYKDVLYICIVKGCHEVAVEHGWEKLDGPYTITSAAGNVLKEINYRNAFEFYKDAIESIENVRLGKEDFFNFAKEHPFGIEQHVNENFFVRDPILVNERDEIICVANIPEGSNLYILKGSLFSLLKSSIRIAEHCAKEAPAQYTPLLFDCISRAMFMGEKFEVELSNIQNELQYMVEGALSIGEIASQNDGELIIHNKSTILGLFTTEAQEAEEAC